MPSKMSTGRRRVAHVRVGRVRVPRRLIVIFAAVAMVFGGVVFTYTVPIAMATDTRFITPQDCTVGLLVGLMFAFLGNAAASAFAAPQGRVSPR